MGTPANTYAIDDLEKTFQCAIEDTYDTEQALVATDVFAVNALSGNIYTGDDEEVTFLGGGGIDIPVLKRNAANGFDLEFLGSYSGSAGVADIMSKLFLMCGGDETIVAGTSASYVTGDKGNLDSMTAKMWRKVSDAKFLEYLTTGARGQLNYSFADGGRGKWTVANMIGSYHQPTVVNVAQAFDYGTQKTAFPKDVNFDTTAEISWDGHEMCVQSLTATNIFGWEFTLVNQPGCKSVRARRVAPTINATIRMPDWEAAFGPYSEQDTSNGVKRRPFVFTHGNAGDDDGKILTIQGAGANEMQMTNVQETVVGNDVGVSFDLRCLTGLEILRT